MTKFNKGDEVFLLDGSKAEYVQELNDGHLVMPLYQREEYYGELEGHGLDVYTSGHSVENEVFADQPTRLLSEVADKVKAAERELSDLERKIRDMKSQQRIAQTEWDRVFADLSRYDGLERFREVLDGKATHVVRTGNRGVEIVEAGAKEGVLTFFFQRKGIANGWELTTKDHRGDRKKRPFAFCFSEEEAEAQALKMRESEIKSRWQNTLKKEPSSAKIADYSLPSKTIDGIEKSIGADNPVTIEIRAWLDAWRADKAKRDRDEKEAELKKLQAELNVAT